MKKLVGLILVCVCSLIGLFSVSQNQEIEEISGSIIEAPKSSVVWVNDIKPATSSFNSIKESTQEKDNPSHQSQSPLIVTIDRSIEEIQISTEVLKEFSELIEYQEEELPKDKVDRYTVLIEAYLKSSFYLNEVIAGFIKSSEEEIKKALKLTVIYSKENDPSELSHTLNLLEEDRNKLFSGALKELTEEEERIIRLIQSLDEAKDG